MADRLVPGPHELPSEQPAQHADAGGDQLPHPLTVHGTERTLSPPWVVGPLSTQHGSASTTPVPPARRAALDQAVADILPTGYVGGDSDVEAYVALQRTTAPYPADAKPGMIEIMASTPVRREAHGDEPHT